MELELFKVETLISITEAPNTSTYDYLNIDLSLLLVTFMEMYVYS